MRAEIPYQVIGGTKFYERAEIKDAIAYLTVLINPQDVGAFTRIVNAPRRGIGATSISRRAGVRQHDGEPDLGRRLGIPSRCPAWAPRRSRRCGGSWARWTCCASGASPTPPIAAAADRAAARDRLPGGARGRAHDRGPGPDREPRGARQRRASSTTPADADDRSLGEFLQQIALIADADDARDDEGLVTLMTLHNAKGLEYPIVFMIGCEEGVFPHSRALDEGGLEEERRLCYVGHHPRRARPVPDVRAHAAPCSARATYGLRQPLHLRDPRRADRPRGQQPQAYGGHPRPRDLVGAARPSELPTPSPQPVAFRLGDDVAHAEVRRGGGHRASSRAGSS